MPAFHNEGQFCSISSRRIHRTKPPLLPGRVTLQSASARLLDMRDGRCSLAPSAQLARSTRRVDPAVLRLARRCCLVTGVAVTGDGLHDDVLEDVAMVRENETWRAGRIAEEDEAQEIQLICLAYSMKVKWYRKSAVYQLDRRVNAEYDTIEEMYMADSARTALSHMDDQEVDQIEAYHPEWDPLDGKHVPWSPEFKLRGSGVTIGKRAMMKDTNEPCEIVRQNQNNLSVHFPRKKEIVQVEESQLTPYDYIKSSGRTTSAVVTTEPGGKRMPMKWMKRVDQLLIQNIFSNKRLYQRLKRISFPEDGAGISFVMGIGLMVARSK